MLSAARDESFEEFGRNLTAILRTSHEIRYEAVVTAIHRLGQESVPSWRAIFTGSSYCSGPWHDRSCRKRCSTSAA